MRSSRTLFSFLLASAAAASTVAAQSTVMVETLSAPLEGGSGGLSVASDGRVRRASSRPSPETTMGT